MSSRVQKGGQKFKPVAKPRGRPVEASIPDANKPPHESQSSPVRQDFTQSVFRVTTSSTALPSVPEQAERTSTSVLQETIRSAEEGFQKSVVSVGGNDTAPTINAPSTAPPSASIFDPEADPGEDLDPTVVTMAAICDDTGQGRVSSKAAIIQHNHRAWKAANKEKRARMRAAMEAKKYGRNEDADGGTAAPPQLVNEFNADDDTLQVSESSSTPAVEDASGSGFNYRESLATNRFNVQVRIGPHGETIIDEESLYVDRAEHADDGTDQYQHVEESDQSKFTNSASYGRKIRGSRWSAEETELFYDALSQFGENYELISYVLPGRDRKSCKNKFKVEDKKNPNRITFCLNSRVPYDMQTLSRLTGKDFSGPTPEIRAPDTFPLAEERQEEQLKSYQPTRKVRKKSKTPAAADDVVVLGDVEQLEMGSDD